MEIDKNLVEDKDLVGVLLEENSKLTLEVAELKVVVDKLVQFIADNDEMFDITMTDKGSGGMPEKPSPVHKGI